MECSLIERTRFLVLKTLLRHEHKGSYFEGGKNVKNNICMKCLFKIFMPTTRNAYSLSLCNWPFFVGWWYTVKTRYIPGPRTRETYSPDAKM
jgi:hypothetical protein